MYSCHNAIREAKRQKKKCNLNINRYTKAKDYLLSYETKYNRKLLHVMLNTRNNIRGMG